MGETAILIAAHKPFDPPALEGYLPVQVGAALAQKDLPVGGGFRGFQGQGSQA